MPEGGKLQIRDKKKGERAVKQLRRSQQRAEVDAETGIPGAGERLEKMEKELEKQKKTIASQEHRIQDLIAFALRIDPTFTIRKD